MNTLIHDIAVLGMSAEVYSIINLCASVIALLFSIWHAKKLGVSLWKIPIILAVAYFGLSLAQSLTYSVAIAMRDAGFLGINIVVNSIVRAFAFLPLLMIPVALILRLKWGLVCDAVAFYPLLTSAIGQLACVFPGCCRGFEAAWGIYNPSTCLHHFPVQILETVLTLAIFTFLQYQLNRRDYRSNGMLYPEMMTLYGIMRFICEALRDNEKIILGCSGVALHATVMFIIGFAIVLYNEIKIKRKVSTEEPFSTDTDSTKDNSTV